MFFSWEWKSGAKSVQILVRADPFLSHMSRKEPELKRAIEGKKDKQNERGGGVP